MKQKLLNIQFPNQYQEGILEIEEGLDNIPELIDYLEAGRSKAEYEKFQQLYFIETMKKCLEEARIEDEQKEVRLCIAEAIREYNAW